MDMQVNYEMLKFLSQGGFGKAYLMRKKEDNELVVIKKSHKAFKEMNQFLKGEEQLLAEKEAKLIVELGQKGSTFIIKGYDAFKTPEGHICIVTEYAQ